MSRKADIDNNQYLDSLLEYVYLHKNDSLSLYHTEILLNEAKAVKSIEYAAHANKIKGLICSKNGDMTRALLLLDSALEGFNETENLQEVVKIKYEIGILQLYEKNYTASMLQFIDLLEILDNNDLADLDEFKYKSYNFIGKIYNELGQNKKALNNFVLSKKFAINNNDLAFLFEINYNLCKINLKLNEYSQAMNYLNECFKLNKQEKDKNRNTLLQKEKVKLYFAMNVNDSAFAIIDDILNQRKNSKLYNDSFSFYELALNYCIDLGLVAEYKKYYQKLRNSIDMDSDTVDQDILLYYNAYYKYLNSDYDQGKEALMAILSKNNHKSLQFLTKVYDLLIKIASETENEKLEFKALLLKDSINQVYYDESRSINNKNILTLIKLNDEVLEFENKNSTIQSENNKILIFALLSTLVVILLILGIIYYLRSNKKIINLNDRLAAQNIIINNSSDLLHKQLATQMYQLGFLINQLDKEDDREFAYQIYDQITVTINKLLELFKEVEEFKELEKENAL